MQRYFNINERGFSVRCKLYSNDPHGAGRIILYGHGFGGHMDNKAAEKFAGRVLSKYRDAAVVTFNWPCHGNDARKKLLLEECDAYLSLVVSHVRDALSARELYGYATSFGGYLFLRHAALHGNPFHRLALRCPAIDMYQTLCRAIMTPESLRSLERGRDTLAGFDRKVRICPQFVSDLRAQPLTGIDFSPMAKELLILHGTADEIVPFAASRDFAAANGIEFVPVEGADHRFQNPAHMEAATKRILSFFGL